MKKKILSYLLVLCMVLTVIPFSMVSVSAAGTANISMTGMTYPSGTLNKGDLFVLRGIISANKTIQRIEIGIVKDEQWVAGHKVDQKVNAKSFNILQKADSKIKFGDLGEGVYKYRCWIWIDGKRYAGFDKQFSVAAKATKITLSGVSHPSTLNKGDLFVLKGTISANKTIQKIEIGIVKNGEWVKGHKVSQKVNAKSYNILKNADLKIKFGDLGEGTYNYRCWVWIDGKSSKAFDYKFTVKKTTKVSYSWPSSTHTVTGYWGLESGHTQAYHYGIDIGARGGSAVKASAPGTVICAGLYQGYGYCVQIKHSDGKVTLYGHMRNSLQVEKGDTVSRGQVVGYVGGTGSGGDRVYAEHLHFGIYKSKSALSREYGSTASAISYNPLNYLP